MWDSNVKELLERIDVNVDKLYFMENVEDECWEIRERDAVQDKNYADYADNDAVIAKFYWAPELAQLLLETLRKLRKQYA